MTAMTDPIFAGKLSLTGDIPDEPPASSASPLSGRFLVSGPPVQLAPKSSWHGTAQFKPLPEPGLSPAAQRVRSDAARLGIDYDAEVARTLNRMKNPGWVHAPGPGDSRAGPDPLKNASPYDYRLAATAVQEQFKRFYGLT